MSTSEILKALRHAPRLDKSSFIRWKFLVEQVFHNLHIENYIFNDLPELQGITDTKSTLIRDQDGNIKAALAQLVPEEIFYLIHGKTTSKGMWDALIQYYGHISQYSIATLLQDFWSFPMEDGSDVDKITEQLIIRKTKISSVDINQTPADHLMKSRILGHFDKCCNGYFSGTVTVLRNDPSISFSGAVSSLRASQASYDDRFRSGVVSLVKEDSDFISRKGKTCAFCKRLNHTRETCFAWLDTPDGSKWAAKNPQKASSALKLKEKYGKKPKTNPTNPVNSASSNNESTDNGIWVVEEHILSSMGHSKNLDIILDTGATHHIFHDRSLFTSFHPTNKRVQTASGHYVSVAAVGSVQFNIYSFQDSSKFKVIQIDDVWYLPLKDWV